MKNIVIIKINLSMEGKMINVIIENEIDELKDVYYRLKNQPYPLHGIEITFKNSKIKYLQRDSTIKIDGYDCYIDEEYFDLRIDIIEKITFKC